MTYASETSCTVTRSDSDDMMNNVWSRDFEYEEDRERLAYQLHIFHSGQHSLWPNQQFLSHDVMSAQVSRRPSWWLGNCGRALLYIVLAARMVTHLRLRAAGPS